VPTPESQSAIACLLSRASIKTLGDPGPDDAQLRQIFEAAVRAPDHGALRPWRFFVVRGDARQRLSDLFVDGLKRRQPAANDAQIEKEREKPLRAPVTIAVVARTVGGHKVPEIEQVLSVGAAAMNALNAIHALGFAAKWITGENCYDAEFKRAFGLEASDQMIGFIQVGTAIGKAPASERPDPSQFVTEWGVSKPVAAE
jgi:nitroreductase